MHNFKSLMNKEQKIINKIRSLILSDDFNIGAQLPGERKLAEMFLTSRNTVRNAIRNLEARGLIEIRKGSGSYLLSKKDRFEAWQGIGSIESTDGLHSLFESKYFIEPIIGAHAIYRIGSHDISALEKCLMRLSRCFIENETRSVADEDDQFRKIIAVSTGNNVFVALIEQFSAANMVVFDYLDRLVDGSKDQLFATYVEMFNGIKNGVTISTTAMLEKNILHQYNILKKYYDGNLPELDTHRNRIVEKRQVPSATDPTDTTVNEGEMAVPRPEE